MRSIALAGAARGRGHAGLGGSSIAAANFARVLFWVGEADSGCAGQYETAMSEFRQARTYSPTQEAALARAEKAREALEWYGDFYNANCATRWARMWPRIDLNGARGTHHYDLNVKPTPRNGCVADGPDRPRRLAAREGKMI